MSEPQAPSPTDTAAPELCEESLAIIAWQEANPDAWGDQDENGVDLTRLRENLKLTPAERLRQNGVARLLASRLEKAFERSRITKRDKSTDASGTRLSRGGY